MNLWPGPRNFHLRRESVGLKKEQKGATRKIKGIPHLLDKKPLKNTGLFSFQMKTIKGGGWGGGL